MSDLYYQQILQKVPTILSWSDTDPYSVTYGCFDRLYWAWKLKDFADATLQRSVYPLALLWQDKDSLYYHSEFLKKIIVAGLHYWITIQHRNGSVDQAFPNEYSFGATAFTLLPLLKSYQILQNTINEKNRVILGRHFRKSADFLLLHDETHGFISNHLAGAALSLLEASKTFDSDLYRSRAEQLVQSVISRQSSEGWFLEYEGFDPGYQTLATYYLAQYWQLSNDQSVFTALKHSIEFLSYFIHPDGSLGGEYGSRNTEIFFPAGFEILRKQIPLAGVIADKIYNKLNLGNTVLLDSVDTGNLIPLMTNYLIASHEKQKSQNIEAKRDELPADLDSVNIYFEDAKLLVKSNHVYYAVIGICKGGVTKVYNKRQKRWIINDAGYIGQIENNDYISTQMYDTDIEVDHQENQIDFTTRFYKISREIPTPYRFLILRFLNLTLMRNLRFGNWIKKILVRLLISHKKNVYINLRRQIYLGDQLIRISDTLSKQNKINLRWLEYGIPFTTIHMASSKYYHNLRQQNFSVQKIDTELLNRENLLNHVNEFKLDQ